MRKVVQIEPHSQGTTTVLALCDDGSMWGWGRHNFADEPAFWKRLADIPQDDAAQSAGADDAP